MTAHLSDETIRRYNLNALHSEEEEFVRRHVDACPKCGARADLLFDEQLRDSEAWRAMHASFDETTPDRLLDFSQQLAREDVEARRLLKDFLEAPTAAYEFIWLNAPIHTGYRTGGVARLLIEVAHSWCSREPLQALQFAEDALQITEAIADDFYPANLIYLYRGDAWKEMANAQQFLTRYAAALESLSRAERAYKRLLSPDSYLASIDLARAIIFAKLKRFDAALAAATRSAETFDRLRDYARYRDARIAEANIHDLAGNPGAARAIVEPLYNDISADLDPRSRAMMATNLGDYSLWMGDTASASMYLVTALQIHEALGLVDDARWTRWNIAYLTLMDGKPSEAARRLRQLAAEFTSAGLLYEAALVKLDLVAAALAADGMKDAARLAVDIFRSFQTADVPTSALSAATYLKQAAKRRSLTLPRVQAVRRFLHQVRQDPELLFIEPE